MSDSNVLLFFKIAGMHSSLKSVNYCFRRTSFWKLKCKWKYKVIKIIVCTFLCVTEGPRVNFSISLLPGVLWESLFFWLPLVVVPTPERHKFGEFGLPGHPWPLTEAPLCPLSRCWVHHDMTPMSARWPSATCVSRGQSSPVSCPPLVGLLAGSKEDWESTPVISRVIFGMELFGQP